MSDDLREGMLSLEKSLEETKKFLKDEKTPTRQNIVTLAKPNFDEIDFYSFRKHGLSLRIEKSMQVLFPRLHYELLSCKTKVTSIQQPLEFGWENLSPMTEMALLGMIAIRVKNQRLEWDAEKLEFKNNEAANALLHKEYRSGWSLE